MLIVAIMSLLCAGGIAFYARFMLALYRECKPQLIGYWVRLHTHRQQLPVAEGEEQRRELVRAA